MEPDEVDLLFDALLNEDSLEDDPDPEAPSEREGVRSWAVHPANIFEALGYTSGEAAALARAVEGYHKIAESKGYIRKPTV